MLYYHNITFTTTNFLGPSVKLKKKSKRFAAYLPPDLDTYIPFIRAYLFQAIRIAQL